MKRLGLIGYSLLILMAAVAQTKLPQVRDLESRGWKIQHSVISWDSLSIYFSAQAAGMPSYDLYVMHADGWRWSEPQRLDAISTPADELWPSVSSDQRTLYYAVRGAEPTVLSQIWRAWYRDDRWTEAAPLIISDIEDSQPYIMEDNCTLMFIRREQTRRNDGKWQTFTATAMDDHNWTLPAQVDVIPAPLPILSISGVIVKHKGGQPLKTGKILVYDAMNGQLLQTVAVHPVTGRWRAALRQGRHYRLAITAPGYSYRYLDIRTDNLETRAEHNCGTVELDDALALTIKTYDAETQTVLDTRQEVLPLGKIHHLTLRHDGYNASPLEVNTERPTVFTQTELDIPLQPQKSRYQFVVTNARTGEPVEQLTLRLNGQPTPANTTLRLNQEQTLQASAPGYLFYDTLFHTGAIERDNILPIRLVPIEKDLVLQLRNIQFEFNSYQLTEGSNDELESLAQLLFINPTLRIELSSHTDDVGSDKYNDRLSTLRGQAVAEWLQARGVDAGRIVAVGYGERKPLVPNDSEEHRAMNRRVEIKVLDY